jgi:hypothetical protein
MRVWTLLLMGGTIGVLAGWTPTSLPGGERRSVMELRQNPEGYHWPEARILTFVQDADRIVRAVAMESMGEPPAVGRRSQVRFRVVERIRGAVQMDELTFQGILVDQDDFNEGEIPYRMVRRSGQRGDCFAHEYRVGAEYLFLLRERNGSLTPHWAPLAPTNEQIRGADDPWLAWVRARVEGTGDSVAH